MSSRGEMKMSLREMTCSESEQTGLERKGQLQHTFSCFKCLSSFSSRYVLFDRTGVLKGFMIFLTATLWLVSWSLAELFRRVNFRVPSLSGLQHTKQDQRLPFRRAGGPSICGHVSLVGVAQGRLDAPQRTWR